MKWRNPPEEASRCESRPRQNEFGSGETAENALEGQRLACVPINDSADVGQVNGSTRQQYSILRPTHSVSTVDQRRQVNPDLHGRVLPESCSFGW